MRDNLENFIHHNRDAFDERDPSPAIWDRLDQQLSDDEDEPGSTTAKVRKIGYLRWIGMAASVVLLIGVGMVIGLNMGQHSAEHAQAEAVVLDEDTERYYKGQVKRRLQRLARYEYASDVEADLKEMDLFLEELKKDLDQVPAEEREAIVIAMIDNYKSRIELLEKVLNKIEPINSNPQKKSDKDEDINI